MELPERSATLNCTFFRGGIVRYPKSVRYIYSYLHFLAVFWKKKKGVKKWNAAFWSFPSNFQKVGVLIDVSWATFRPAIQLLDRVRRSTPHQRETPNNRKLFISLNLNTIFKNLIFRIFSLSKFLYIYCKINNSYSVYNIHIEFIL